MLAARFASRSTVALRATAARPASPAKRKGTDEHLRADRGAGAEAGPSRAGRNLARDRRGPLPPLPGLRDQTERDPGQAGGGRPFGREPGLLGSAVAEGGPDLRDRRDQEPRDLLRAS